MKHIVTRPQRQRIIGADRIEQKEKKRVKENCSVHQSGKLMQAGLKDIQHLASAAEDEEEEGINPFIPRTEGEGER